MGSATVSALQCQPLYKWPARQVTSRVLSLDALSAERPTRCHSTPLSSPQSLAQRCA